MSGVVEEKLAYIAGQVAGLRRLAAETTFEAFAPDRWRSRGAHRLGDFDRFRDAVLRFPRRYRG